MADFQAHVKQAKKNLIVLSEINEEITNSWDWQVTTAYYVAVHLMNAHLARSADFHYASHEKVKNALFNAMSPGRIDEQTYLTYCKLENLSRRARYLCNDSESKEPSVRQAEREFLTHGVHLKKTLIKLNDILIFFNSLYGENFDVVVLDCLELKNADLKYFKYINRGIKLTA